MAILSSALAPVVYELFQAARSWVAEKGDEEQALSGYRWAMVLELRTALNLLPIAISEAEAGNQDGVRDIIQAISLPVTRSFAMAAHGSAVDREALFDVVTRESRDADDNSADDGQPAGGTTVDELNRAIARLSTMQVLVASDSLSVEVRWATRIGNLRDDFLAALRTLLVV